MSSGMYSALSGAIASMQQLDIISNNLANINNSGFKKDEVQFESLFQEQLQTNWGDGVNFNRIRGTSTDFTQGGLKETGRNLDLAIDGEGFFKVATEEGFSYTRSGDFQLREDGALVTPSGEQLVGEQGPVSLPHAQVRVEGDGTVLDREGEEVDRISVYNVQDSSLLEKQGDNLWRYTGEEGDEPATADKLRQGFLEESNVSTMHAMTELIEAKRLFQAYQRDMQAYGDVAEKAIEIGRIG